MQEFAKARPYETMQHERMSTCVESWKMEQGRISGTLKSTLVE